MERYVQLKKNIGKNYLFTLLSNVDLTRGIWMLYLASKGMSLAQLGLLETVFHLTSFAMEVPTGAVADLFGRKASRVLGRVFSLAGVALLLLADGFYWFAASFILTALSYNLESGAGDALVYDSLKEIGEEAQFMRIEGNKEVFYEAAGTVSFLAGGYLATKSYTAAFTLTILTGAATLLQSLSFKEPGTGKRRTKAYKGNLFLTQLHESVAVVRKNPKIGTLIVLGEIIMTFCTCIFYYLQNYMKGDGYNEAAIGLVYALSSLGAAAIAPQVHKIEKRIKERGILVAMPFVTMGCIWGVALSRYHYVFFILLMLTESIIFVAMSDYINKMIPSENRATVLSFSSMAFSFFMITLFPFIGMLGDRYSLGLAFKCLGGLCSVFVLLNAGILSRKTEYIDDRRIKY